MATAAQIEANRRNAARSTGPRTVQGKDRARMNALMHGLTADTFERPEEAERRAMLREQLLAEWRPGSMMEVVVLNQMVEATLKLERVPEARAFVLATIRKREQVPDHISNTRLLAADLSSGGVKLEPIERYEQKLSRQLSRLIRDLRQLQQNRANCDAEAVTEEAQNEIDKTNPIPPQVEQEKAVVPAAIRMKWPMVDPIDLPGRQVLGWRVRDRSFTARQSRVPVGLSA